MNPENLACAVPPVDVEAERASAFEAARLTEYPDVVTARERDDLPPGTVALDGTGRPWYRGTGSWVSTGDGPPLDDYVEMTLYVIHPASVVDRLRLQQRVADLIRDFAESYTPEYMPRRAAAAIFGCFDVQRKEA